MRRPDAYLCNRLEIDIDRSSSAVVARFADGGTEQGDVLIGCDGINSTTRHLALPESPAPTYSGLLGFGGMTNRPDVPLEIGINVMVFGRRAFFGAFKTPSGQVWWFHNSGEKHPEAMIRNPSAQRAQILLLHREDPPWILDVI